MYNLDNAEPGLHGTVKWLSRFYHNFQGDDCKTYYQRSIAIPVTNNITLNLPDWVSDKNLICLVTNNLSIPWFRYATKLDGTW